MKTSRSDQGGDPHRERTLHPAEVGGALSGRARRRGAI